MSLKSRRTVFYLLAVLFLIITPTLLSYTAGYRWSFTRHRLVKTGALSLSTYPGGAEITINNKRLEEKTPTLISHLLPGSYDISIEKEGYYGWHKTLVVESENTTFAHDITIFRETVPILNALLALDHEPIDNFPGFKDYKILYDTKQGRVIIIDNATKKRISEIPGTAAIWRVKENPLLFVYSPHEVWQFDPKKKSLTLITRLSEEIQQVLPIPERNAIILIHKERVSAVELDLRDKQNLWNLASFERIEYATIQNDNKKLLIDGTRAEHKGVWELEL